MTTSVRAVDAAGLLVGEERDDEVARRLLARRGRSSRTAARIMASMSFMSTAPRPQTQSSRDLAGERVDLPVVGAGGDDVEVAVDQQAGPRGVCARECARTRWPGAAATRTRSGSRPTSASMPATYSAASRSPGPEPSPKFVESMRMSSRQMSTTSASAPPATVCVLDPLSWDMAPLDVVGRLSGEPTCGLRRRSGERRAVRTPGWRRANLDSRRGPEQARRSPVRVAELADALA